MIPMQLSIRTQRVFLKNLSYYQMSEQLLSFFFCLFFFFVVHYYECNKALCRENLLHLFKETWAQMPRTSVQTIVLTRDFCMYS